MKVFLIACIIFAIAVLFFFFPRNETSSSGIIFRKDHASLWQDQVSGTVEKRENGKNVPIYVGQGFDRERAKWKQGVNIAYVRPVYEGDSMYIWSNGTFYDAKIEVVKHSGGAGEIEITFKGNKFSFSEAEAIKLNSEKVMWSFKSDGAAYLYFDDYTKNHPEKAICVKSDDDLDGADWFYFTPWQKTKAEDLQGFSRKK